MKTIQHQDGYGITVILLGLATSLLNWNWQTLLGCTIFLGFYFVIRLLCAIHNRLNQIYHKDNQDEK